MDDLKALQSVGFRFPGPAYLFGVVCFSVIGFAAYRYGKKASRQDIRWTGVALMLYPYAVPDTWVLYAVGVGLCAALYFWSRPG